MEIEGTSSAQIRPGGAQPRAGSRNTAEPSLGQAVEARLARIDELRRMERGSEQAEKTLRAKADDLKANLTAGRFYCLARQDWPHGLSLLAKGNAGAISAAAAQVAASRALVTRNWPWRTPGGVYRRKTVFPLRSALCTARRLATGTKRLRTECRKTISAGWNNACCRKRQ